MEVGAEVTEARYKNIFDKWAQDGQITKEDTELIFRSFGGNLNQFLPAECNGLDKYNLTQFENIISSFQQSQPVIIREKAESLKGVLEFFAKDGMVSMPELVRALKNSQSEEIIIKLLKDSGISDDESYDIQSLLTMMLYQ